MRPSVISHSIRPGSWRTRDQGYWYFNDNRKVAGVTSASPCTSSYKGYTGLSDVNDLTNAASLTYSSGIGVVVIATDNHDCNEGMMVIQQGTQYGVLKFEQASSVYDMTIKWWLGASGVTDFSQAPD